MMIVTLPKTNSCKYISSHLIIVEFLIFSEIKKNYCGGLIPKNLGFDQINAALIAYSELNDFNNCYFDVPILESVTNIAKTNSSLQ